MDREMSPGGAASPEPGQFRAWRAWIQVRTQPPKQRRHSIRRIAGKFALRAAFNTPMETRAVRIEELLAHAGWVQELASRLVRDPGTADDVTQEVWARALSSPPRERTNLRGWLAATVRTTARALQRGQSRRSEHEQRGSEERDETSASELVERAQLHHVLVEEVLKLPEEQRSIVLARWFEGRSITAIAERRGLTPRVAKARLDEAHAELRRRLDASNGGRAAWLAAFGAWTQTPAAVATGSGIVIGGLAMGTKVKLSLACAVALLLWLGLRDRTATPEPSPTPVVAAQTEKLELDSSSAAKEVRAEGSGLASVLDAHVVVHVRDAWTKMPVQGASVSAGYFSEQYALLKQRMSDEQIRELMRARTTTESGDEILDIPSGIPLLVTAHHDGATDGGLADELAALTPGERRELTLVLHIAPDVHFFARVLDRANSRPIEGAVATLILNPTLKQQNEDRARLLKDNLDRSQRLQFVTEDAAPSDATGQVEFRIGSWRLRYLRIHAAGFVPALVFPEGHSAADDPLDVLLEQANAVECTILDGAGAPVVDVEVTLSGDYAALLQPQGTSLPQGKMPPATKWTGKTGTDGRCTIDELPSGMNLRPKLVKAGVNARGTPDSFTLEPGERRKIEWRFGAMCTLSGRVLDGESKPVAGVELWLQCVSDDPLSPPEKHRRYFHALASGSINASATSDSEGRFHFDEIAPGRIWVGPACAQDRGVTPGALAPIADELVIPVTATTLEHDIRVEPARYVSGRVVDSNGKPVHTAVRLGARERDADWRFTSGDDGAFVAGPVSEGEFWMQAAGAAGCCESEALRVRAGGSGAVLTLRPGASLGASLVDDESGEICTGQLHAYERGSYVMGRYQNDSRDPARFELRGILPALYDVVGRTQDGRVGLVRGVNLDPRTPMDLVVRVARGAKLKFKCEGKQGWGTFIVHSGESDLVRGSVSRGAVDIEFVLPGHLVIEYWPLNTGDAQRREIDIEAGEEQELVFRDEG